MKEDENREWKIEHDRQGVKPGRTSEKLRIFKKLMKLTTYILSIFFILLSTGTTFAQKEKAYPKTKAPSTLERARSLKSEKPKEAIRLIESVVK